MPWQERALAAEPLPRTETIFDGSSAAPPASAQVFRASADQQPDRPELNEARLLGARIGHIRIVDLLANGGMGSVFIGFDEKLERRVAVKAVRQGLLDAGGRARFLREARILSQLQHPHISQIHEYVSGEERDFLVLELIEGKNLKDAIAEDLSEACKWRIAEQIVDVLVAAHGKGIIHRDLKPQNVMLTAKGEVKVLDFGLARAIDSEVTQTIAGTAGSAATPRTVDDLATKLGVVVGTLAYMSPEQARGEAVTTASDMYSCGLVLQELFTGRPACETGLSPAERWARAKAGITQPVSGVSADLKALIERLKAVAPAARPSAVDTAERLRWIREAPRRTRRRLALAAGFVAVALVAVGMSFQAYRIAQEARRANLEAEASRQVSDLMIGLFEVADPDEGRGSTVTAREILERGAGKIERDLADQPLLQARMFHTIGAVYQELGLYEKSRATHEKALAIRDAQLGPEHPDVALTLEELGGVHLLRGEADRAERLFLRALAIREKAQAPTTELAGILSDLASVHQAKGSSERALALYARTLAIQERTLGADHGDVAETLYKLGELYREVGDLQKAEAHLFRALRIFESRSAADPETQQWLAWTQVAVGRVLRAQGRVQAAERSWRRAVGITQSVAAGSDGLANLHVRAHALLLLGRVDEARPIVATLAARGYESNGEVLELARKYGLPTPDGGDRHARVAGRETEIVTEEGK